MSVLYPKGNKSFWWMGVVGSGHMYDPQKLTDYVASATLSAWVISQAAISGRITPERLARKLNFNSKIFYISNFLKKLE